MLTTEPARLDASGVVLTNDIAERYRTDKGRSRHRYTNFYGSMLGDHRDRILNVTEAGVRSGASIRLWLDLFPKAHVWGLDVSWKEYRDHVNHLRNHDPRLHLATCCRNQLDVDGARLVPNSMDLVIEDAGNHDLALQTLLFPLLWPLVRLGGYYVIEDVDDQRGGLQFTQNHSGLHPTIQRILENNYAFMVDSTPGMTESQWKMWQEAGQRRPVGGLHWVHSRSVHNSHLLVIRRVQR